MKRLALFVFTLSSVFGQQFDWDTSGNGLLSGTYNFREVLWIADLQATNNLDEAASQYGTITFDGQGNYTMSATEWSSATNAARNYVRAGTYAISASGFGFVRRASTDGDYVYGSVANGVFIGSGTESGFNNLFIAARQGSPAVTTATFNQRYTMAYMNLPATSLTEVLDATFQIVPNGSGSLGSISVSGFKGGSYTAVTQTISNASYTFASGVGTLNFGAKNATDLVSGSQQLFVSSDGQFVFGGSTNGWDMIVGVRTATTAPAFNGLYYQAGMDVKRSSLPSGTAALGSYYGSFNVISSVESMIGHQRIQTAPDAPFEFTYSDGVALSSTGTHNDFQGLQNFVSSGGNIRVGFGRGDFLGLNVAVKAPLLSGAGVYLNPTGVVNAASFTPFTTGISPGELITLFGTGMASGDFSDAGFPLVLGGVSVRINGRQAPLYVVSPTQISVVVPYDTARGVAEIQVTRNGTAGNRVTVYVNDTSPGVFAVPATGLGYAAALHGDYSLVSDQNPARPGETISVYLTGLGAVNPPVADGAAGPTDPLSRTTGPLDVSLGGRNATISYSGLAPVWRGLYQLNIQIPADVSSNQYLDINASDALSSQILIPIAGARSASTSTPQRTRPTRTYRSPVKIRRGFDPAPTGSTSSPSRDR